MKFSKRYNYCVSIQGLRPLKATYVKMLQEGCPDLKAPSNAAFFSLFLDDAPLLSFVASHIPRFFVRPKRKKERKWRHCVAYIVTFAGLGGRNCDVRIKHLVTQPGNATKARLSHLATVDAVNKVSPKDSPSKTRKAGTFEGCRP